ncbi:MAG: WhiB family transcriptional regulator [Propionibacteriaceae bacterium]
MTTLNELYRHIAQTVDDGQEVPCLDPESGHLWTSNKPKERYEAKLACLAGPCPVFNLCITAAQAEKINAGVWGGIDIGGGA